MENGGRLFIGATAEKEGVAIVVRDTGCGIEPTNLLRIFDPYFTTKQNGTGLGLALSLKIIEEHGGTIRVSSQPQQGSTVTIVLPTAG